MKYIKLFHTIRKHWTSYAIATMLFPKEIRDKVLLLYSFVRKPDNIVDQDISQLTQEDKVHHYQNIKQQLQSMLNERKIEYEQWTSDYAQLFHSNNIPYEYSQCFYEAMMDDCDRSCISTYQQLEHYMFGSATIVGYMMNCIVWVNDTQADAMISRQIKDWIRCESWSETQARANKLAQAMQLTNFLRDIKEDYLQFNRIYIPLDILQRFELDTQDIEGYCKQTKIDYDSKKRHKFVEMMRYLIATCRTLYSEAEQWYHLLPNIAINAVRLSWILYEWILDKIESNNYDVFTTSARTTLLDKYMIIRSWKQKQKTNPNQQLSYEVA